MVKLFRKKAKSSRMDLKKFLFREYKEMSHHSNQADVDDISTKLKFISMIEPDQRVNVNQTLSLHSKYSWMNRLRRTYVGTEGRQATHEFIKDTINRSYELLLSLRHSNSEYDMQVYRKIIMELMAVENGIRSLIETYQKDPEYVSILSTLIDSLKIKIRELCDYKEIDLAELTLEVETELAVAEAEVEETAEKKKIQALAENSNDDSELSSDVSEEGDVTGETSDDVETSGDVDVTSETSDDVETSGDVDVTSETSGEADQETTTESDDAESSEIVGQETDEHSSELDGCLPPFSSARSSTPVFDKFDQPCCPEAIALPDSPDSSELPESVQDPVPLEELICPSDKPVGDPQAHKVHEIPMETNPELLELLNRVNLGPRRRNKRRRMTPEKINDVNPYSALKLDFTYDLESGLQPPRAPLKRKII